MQGDNNDGRRGPSGNVHDKGTRCSKILEIERRTFSRKKSGTANWTRVFRVLLYILKRTEFPLQCTVPKILIDSTNSTVS